jgi:pyruvate/2-oxoacid:ferredoxin oxidoreductase alpha subunit
MELYRIIDADYVLVVGGASLPEQLKQGADGLRGQGYRVGIAEVASRSELDAPLFEMLHGVRAVAMIEPDWSSEVRQGLADVHPAAPRVHVVNTARGDLAHDLPRIVRCMAQCLSADWCVA